MGAIAYAARIGDPHACPAHGDGRLAEGARSVIIDGKPAVREGDLVACPLSQTTVLRGEPSVLFNGKPAARVLDKSGHGGLISQGSSSVTVGRPRPDDGSDDRNDGFFRIVHSVSREPVAGARYRITKVDGAVFEGKTDAAGHTQVVATGPRELLHIEIFPDNEVIVYEEDTEASTPGG